MLGQMAVLAPVAAVAGGVIGAYTGTALNAGAGDGPTVARRGPRWALPLAGVAIAACIAYPLPMNAGAPGAATASLHTVQGSLHIASGSLHTAPGSLHSVRASPAVGAGGPEVSRSIQGTFTLSPRTMADDAQWVQIIDWQGGGLVVDRLRRLAAGAYATTQPIPVGGKWKAILRVANGRSLRGVPVYLPNDPAIPAVGAPASAHFTRPFEREKHILQREAVGGPAGLATIAYLLLLAIVSGWLASIVWGMRRMGLAGGARAGTSSSPGGGAGGQAEPRSDASSEVAAGRLRGGRTRRGLRSRAPRPLGGGT
jgi:hypothetical protein